MKNTGPRLVSLMATAVSEDGRGEQQNEDGKEHIKDAFLNEIGIALGQCRVKIEHVDAAEIGQAIAKTCGFAKVHDEANGNTEFFQGLGHSGNVVQAVGWEGDDNVVDRITISKALDRLFVIDWAVNLHSLTRHAHETDDATGKYFAVHQRQRDSLSEAVGADQKNFDFGSAVVSQHLETNPECDAEDTGEKEESDRTYANDKAGVTGLPIEEGCRHDHAIREHNRLQQLAALAEWNIQLLDTPQARLFGSDSPNDRR
ncbi:MAG: hypothetical protein WB817_15040 [Terriglobales bacterium]